jgi:pimeloyl-ACP methyl ester carboxylesterase
MIKSTVAAALACSALLMTPGLADDDFTSGHAIAHDGTKIYFEVHGSGAKTLFLGPGTASATRGAPSGVEVPEEMLEFLRTNRLGFLDGFTDAYRVILIDYPGEPKMYTLTPAVVARDYLAIADAAGAKTFAYYGFSWGCVTGLQLALRTDRLEALVCGGFPAMDGPYPEMLEITREVTHNKASPMFSPENGRQFLTYYEGLQSFDDHAIQVRLSIPRLNWIGSEDVVEWDGKPLTNMSQTMIDNREALEQAGWDVKIVPGHDHQSALAASVAVPLVREWLDANWTAQPNEQGAKMDNAPYERPTIELNSHTSVLIELPAEAIWPHIIDPSEWKQGASVIHVAGPKGGLGEISGAVMLDAPETVLFYAKTVELEPNRRKTIKLYGTDNGPLIGYASWVLEPMGDSTRVSYHVYSEMLLSEAGLENASSEEVEAYQAQYFKANHERFQNELEGLKALVEATR